LGAKVILRALKSKTTAQRSCAKKGAQKKQFTASREKDKKRKKGRKKRSCARHSYKNKNGSQGEPLEGVKKESVCKVFI
jgi:hypothetical protein